MSKEIFKYIEKNKFKTTSKDKDANLQFMPGGIDMAWTCKVPNDKMLEFHKKYYELKVKPGHRCHLLEKPMKKKNILKIDIDLRYTPTQEDITATKLKHKYSKEIIKEFIRVYMKIVNKYVEVPSDAKVTLMEKKHPRFVDNKKKYIKDGIHIICPEIIAPNPVLMTIYNEFVEDQTAIEIFEKFNNSEPIHKAVDSRVIFTNSWYLLGSGKPADVLDYYKPTKVYSISYKNSKNELTVKLKPTKLDMTELEMITYYSNYGKDECNPLRDTVNIEQLENDLKIGGKKSLALTNFEKSKYIENIPKQHFKKVKVKDDYVYRLLCCLKQSRVEDYNQWLNVACCIYNISPKLFPLFLTWSKKGGVKYSEDGCFRLWYETLPKYADKYSHLSFDTLKNYALQDNEKEYYTIFNTKKKEFFENMITNLIKTNFDRAIKDCKFVKYVDEYISSHCPFSLRCADIKNNLWFIFKNNRWVKDEGANYVYKIFTHDFINNFQSRYNDYDDIIKNARNKIQSRNINNILQNNMLSPDMDNMMQQINNNYNNNVNTNNINANNYNTEEYVRNTLFSNEETLIETCEKSKKSITQLCEFINKPANRNNIIKDLCHECYDEDFYQNLDTNTNIFICNNCVLDLKDCIIRDGQPGDMNSIYSNITFPLDVTSDLAMECFDEIEELLDKLFPDLDVRDYVMNYYAEALSGEHRREEFCIHTGSGSNGKSAFSKLLSFVFGGYYYEPEATIYSNYNPDPNSPQPVIYQLRGKRLVMTQEIKNTKTLETATIKKMTGGDPISARTLHAPTITFKTQCKFNMSCNDIPELDSNDDAIFRRIIVIPYISTFVDVGDKKLKNPDKFKNHYPKDYSINEDKMKKWAPYFLYLLWQRYIDLHRENFKQLLVSNRPDAVSKATEEYKIQSNMFSNFIAEYIEYDIAKKQGFKEIFAEFKSYASSIDGKFKSNKQCEKNLRRELVNCGGIKRRENNEDVYHNISLNGQGIPI
jgi:P4 family phage/plasmid primase-like protien